MILPCAQNVVMTALNEEASWSWTSKYNVSITQHKNEIK